MNIQRINEVLSMAPDDRKDYEIRIVMEWLRTKVNIFKDVKDNILINLVKECYTVTKEEDEIIIREGDIGDCMYILMSGYLHIYRKYDPAEADDSKKHNRKEGPVGNTSENFFSDRTPFGEDVVVLNTPGTVFGEIALIEDCPRTASIIADSPAVLLLVHRDLYNRTVRSVIEAEFQTKLGFINNDPLFRQWNMKFKNQLAMSLEIMHFDYDSIIVRQGQRANVMFFILQGEVLLSACPDQHITQYPKYINVLSNYRDSEIKVRGQRKAIDIALLDGCDTVKSSCFGDVEWLIGLDTYSYTAMTTQNTVTLQMNIKNFDRLIVKKTPQMIRRMKLHAERRVEAWVQRTADHLPLLHLVRQRLKAEGPVGGLLLVGSGDSSANTDQNGTGKHMGRSKKAGSKFALPKWGPLVDQTGPGSVFHYIRLRNRARQKANVANLRGVNKLSQQPSGVPEDTVRSNDEVPNDLEDGISLIQLEPVFDAQTSETALSSLESKMREFLDDKPQSVQNSKPHVVKLARYNPEAITESINKVLRIAEELP